ncbi:MAG TPA: FAD:protein FMN transferase [Acidimicrobiales bacterium]|nr:FAD:protein FMN transferase [Acidimicrobiales bacterium]
MIPTATADELVRRAEPVMGTVVSIHVRPGDIPAAAVHLAIADARAALHRADAVFSTWKEHSPISQLRRGELAVDHAPPEVAEVLRRCAEARELSGGWFDPWAAPGGVDPTGLVKGWATGRALDVLRRAGVAAAMVSAGGDMALWGRRGPSRPWRIGIQNPFERSTLVAVAEPAAAIATSGCYERGAHVWDPFTGQPAEAVASATVTGPDLGLADAMATALLAGGDRALPYLERLDGYEALLIGHDGALRRTAGFPEGCPAVAALPPAS